MNIRETDIYEEGRNDGISQGAEQTKIETAKNMILENLSLEVIARTTGLPFETIRKLLDEQQVINQTL